MFYGYIDESGSDSLGNVNDKRNKFFVLVCILVNKISYNRLLNEYEHILDNITINNISIRDIFMIYERITNRKAELKASYILDKKGPFWCFRDADNEFYKNFKDKVFTEVAKALRNSGADLLAIVINKERLLKISKIRGVNYDPRLLALDFMFTRIAILLEKKSSKAILIHDNTNKKDKITDVLNTMKQKGYFYNPYFRRKPNYRLIIDILFEDSSNNFLLQYADILANIIRRKHAYGEVNYYRIIAGSPWFYIRVYPKN